MKMEQFDDYTKSKLLHFGVSHTVEKRFVMLLVHSIAKVNKHRRPTRSEMCHKIS
uniref:Uncharacterized protein n=1 Tax=Kalanchoe fedtschenkoi TaxID=63787 RepID=A0A7N0UF28_KALFE